MFVVYNRLRWIVSLRIRLRLKQCKRFKQRRNMFDMQSTVARETRTTVSRLGSINLCLIRLCVPAELHNAMWYALPRPGPTEYNLRGMRGAVLRRGTSSLHPELISLRLIFCELFHSDVVSTRMRSLPPTFVVCILLMGCASTPRKVQTTSDSHQAAEPVVTVPVARMENRRIPLIGGVCPLIFPPHDVGSVLIVPATIMSRAMDPIMNALCSCTKPREYAAIVTQINFSLGSAYLQAPESSQINECLESLHVTFAPVPESDLPSSDCINCGPHHYGVFVDSPPPPKNTGLRLMYSFLLDRSSEVLDCPAPTHAERGACRTAEAPPSIASPKPTCGCDATDLACAITCAGAR
jgi:hypothetical protein